MLAIHLQVVVFNFLEGAKRGRGGDPKLITFQDEVIKYGPGIKQQNLFFMYIFYVLDPNMWEEQEGLRGFLG